jgi:hypothetical protein
VDQEESNTHVGERFLVKSVAEMKGMKRLTLRPIHKMANLKRLTTAMNTERIHSICEMVTAFEESATDNPSKTWKTIRAPAALHAASTPLSRRNWVVTQYDSTQQN